jgi:hypothetical protein
MAVNLAKICADLAHPDPQIKTFALMSITRLSPQIVDSPAEIREIAARLKPLSASDNPDVVFLARKAFNHIDSAFKDCLHEQPAAAPASPMAGSHAVFLQALEAPVVPVTVAATPVQTVAIEPQPAAVIVLPTEPTPVAAAIVISPEPAPAPAVVAVAAAPVVVPAAVPVAAAQVVTPAAAPPVVSPAPRTPPPRAPAAPPKPAGPPLPDAAALSRPELLDAITRPLPTYYIASCLIQLASKGTTADLDALRSLLEHPDDRVRANAIEVFERLGVHHHIDWLVPRLADRNNRARGNAAVALAKLGYAGVEDTLRDMLAQSAMSMRETAVYVLSKIDMPFVEALLLHALDDPYEGVRLRATKALARYPTRPVVIALKRMLNDLDINICEAAAEALRGIKVLLQSQRAAAEAALPLAPEKVEPAPPPPTAAAPAPVPASAPEKAAQLDELYRGLGTEIYQLCRLNVLTHENLDSVFYEVLRYQDFLRNYMVKRGDPEDATRTSAIEHLQDKIKASFTQLGRQAAELLQRQQLQLPAREGEPVRKLLAELAQANRAGA